MCAVAGDTSRCTLTAAEGRVVQYAAERGAAGLPANVPAFAMVEHRYAAMANVKQRAESEGVAWDRVRPHALAAYRAALNPTAETE
jgi:hypothetical protein